MGKGERTEREKEGGREGGRLREEKKGGNRSWLFFLEAKPPLHKTFSFSSKILAFRSAVRPKVF